MMTYKKIVIIFTIWNKKCDCYRYFKLDLTNDFTSDNIYLKLSIHEKYEHVK